MTPEITAVLVITATVLTLCGLWKVFEKAGESGWKSIVPVYNFYTLLRISDFSGWWTLSLFAPSIVVWLSKIFLPHALCPGSDVACGSWLSYIPNPVSSSFWSADLKAILIIAGSISLFIVLTIGFVILLWSILFHLSRLFGKSVWFSVGLLFLPFVFFPILGLSNSKYTQK